MYKRQQQNKVESVIALEKGGLLYEPNDYYYNGSPMSQLDLIRAPLAWELTKGSPNVFPLYTPRCV